jgi:hypothetical protein
MQRRFCLAQDGFCDTTYNVPGLFEVPTNSTEDIQEAFRAIAAGYAIFRTRFELILWRVVSK